MVKKAGKIRLLSFVMAMAMMLSLATTAMAVDMDEAKASLATVDITQKCNGSEKDAYQHNYAYDGNEVKITYWATLRMTDTMATYLQARQHQLMDAKFVIHVMMDMEKLEFTETGDKVTVTFTSSFLKPQDAAFPVEAGYQTAFAGCANGIYTYNISMNKAWAQSYIETNGGLDIPMELIVYYDANGNKAYGYDALGNIPFSVDAEKPMFYDFIVDDWMKEIKIELANLRVKDSVRESITNDSSTWKTVEAKGTITGSFTYERWAAIENIGDYGKTTEESKNTLSFGDKESGITGWISNVVTARLIYHTSSGSGSKPESPYLNLDDHFAYIIGYPVDYITGETTDDMSRWPVKPEGTITRAEVATIFFRMLTDEVRNHYWSQTNPYDDVEITDWYNNAISTLTNLGVLEGYLDGGFHPNDEITRAEFATMAVRFFVTGEYDWDEDAFSDIEAHWANEYINLAYLLDLVNGYPDGTYRPQNPITRAEAMTIVNNTLRRTPCDEGIKPMEDDKGFIAWPDNMDKSKWYYSAVQEATNSHEYTYFTEKEQEDKELWQKILPVRDWAAFEKAWSDANSASNPGEVVSSK